MGGLKEELVAYSVKDVSKMKKPPEVTHQTVVLKMFPHSRIYPKTS